MRNKNTYKNKFYTKAYSNFIYTSQNENHKMFHHDKEYQTWYIHVVEKLLAINKIHVSYRHIL